MHTGIYAVEPMRQHAYCGQPRRHRCPMGAYVYPIGKAAHHKGAGKAACQIVYKRGTYILAIFGGMACSNYCHHMFGIQVDISQRVHNDGGIATFPQAIGVAVIGNTMYFNTLGLNEIHLAVGILENGF